MVAGVRYRCRRDTGVARIAVTVSEEGKSGLLHS